MRPFFYAFSLFGLLYLAPPVAAKNVERPNFINSFPRIGISATYSPIVLKDLSLALNHKALVYKEGHKASEKTKPTGIEKRLKPQTLLNRVNLPWNLNSNIRFQDFKKHVYSRKHYVIIVDASATLVETHEKLKKSRLKGTEDLEWIALGKSFTVKKKKKRQSKSPKTTLKRIVEQLNISNNSKGQASQYISFYGNQYSFPFKLHRIRVESGGELFTTAEEINYGMFGDYELVEETTIFFSKQKIQLRYASGSKATLEAKDLLKSIEEKDTLILKDLSSLTPLQKGEMAPPHPFLDPLVMVYRSLRGDYHKWKPSYSFTDAFVYEKVRWKSPDDNLVKYIVGLHLHGRANKLRFKGGNLNYQKIMNIISTPPLYRDYDNWSEYVYAFANDVVLLPAGPDPNHPQLIVHRSQPVYQDERTTLFDISLSVIKEGKEERVYLTGSQHEKLYMVSNTFADELGDNYLHGDSYTLSFESMPSHMEWPNPIRVTNFGVFIHRGQSAKRYAGCKGLTSIFDFNTMTMPVWESMRCLKSLRSIKDKNMVPEGNFWLKNNSYAPGATPSSSPQGTPVVIGGSLLDEAVTL